MRISNASLFGAPIKSRSRARRLRALGALLCTGAMLVTGAQMAGAQDEGPPPQDFPPLQTVAGPHADGLAGPLELDLINGGRKALVNQSFAGTASIVSSDGTVEDVFNEPGLNGIAAGPFGTIVYTVTAGAGPDEGGPLSSVVKIRFPWGATRTIADLAAYESANNPDGGASYGIADLSEECAAQWPTEQFGPPSFHGDINSNPFKVKTTLFGALIADSGANAIWFVDWFGNIRTVAVLPPQPYVISDPSALGLPECTAGKTFNFEPVPTDIELSGLFDAYVSLLPGGPEGPELGARGSVVRLNLWTGRSTPVASGFLGATDLALSPRGDLYVSELFGNKVTKITKRGVRSTLAELPMPAAVEWGNGRLVVAYNVFGPGAVATIRG